MSISAKTLMQAGIALAMLVVAVNATAAPVSKCNAVKKRCIGKYVTAVMGCHAKAESKGLVVDPVCLAKAAARITGGGKGCFDKVDAIPANDCSVSGDAAEQSSVADGFVIDVVDDVDPSYPAPVVSKCGAARKKCVGKAAAGLMTCATKENRDGVGDPACAPKIMAKFAGCDAKALAKGPDCDGSATTASLEAKTDAWQAVAAATIDGAPSGPICGNGVIDPGEFCDPAAPGAREAACGPQFPCNPYTCNCECPALVHLSAGASDPESMEIGWTGLAHGTPLITNADLTLGVVGCEGTEHPCGICDVTGPVANAGPNELQSRRCTNDTSTHCTDDAPCAGGGGTCEFFLGSALPIASGGVATCTVSRIFGDVTGTVNFENGDTAAGIFLHSRVHVGAAIDAPCPRCVGDGELNDGVQGGTCSGGTRNGLACDANAEVPNRPDFGSTSLDCPPNPASLLATLPIDLSMSTAGAVKPLSAASPPCSGQPGERCLCDTCNNAVGEPCENDSQCPDPPGPTGPVCGGRRCIGGVNNGTPCATGSECPGGVCGRPGEPTKPSSCLDDTSTVGELDCGDPGTGRTECLVGPITTTCSEASGHAQRGCTSDADCGGAAGSCESSNRRCFPTGGFSDHVGTNALVASGLAGVPVQGASQASLGAVSCIAPTSAAAVNNVVGLPGPAAASFKKGVKPQPPPFYGCTTAYDVGVIPQQGKHCPNRFVGMYADAEKNNNNSYLSGWTGAITRDSEGMLFGFCRVDGTQLHQVPAAPYAVLKLGSACPPGSIPAEHHIDTENSTHYNYAVGNIWPSQIGNSNGASFVKMVLCVFPAGGPSTTFPNLRYPYGVFAPPNGSWLSQGHAHGDDEDTSAFGWNAELSSGDSGYTHSSMIYTTPGQSRPNSEYKLAKVRNDPCTNQCPLLGGWDGANCLVGTPPVGTTAFIYQGSFYYTPVNVNQCPHPGSFLVGNGCFVQTPPPCSGPFIYQNRWYVGPVCRP